MNETLDSMRRKIQRAQELQSVVRTMKALSVANISQYEKSVQSLSDYTRTVELGLKVCFQQAKALTLQAAKDTELTPKIGAIVFGSGQGLVGQFNDVICDKVSHHFGKMQGEILFWAVGESVMLRLEEAGFRINSLFSIPSSVKAISLLISQLVLEIEAALEREEFSEIYLFYNRLKSKTAYEPVRWRFFPFDKVWLESLNSVPWPTNKIPEAVYSMSYTAAALVREYLFVRLFMACAESLASENASRLVAMQRAEKNIKELLNDLRLEFHQLRQSSIDTELFDVIFGSEALNNG